MSRQALERELRSVWLGLDRLGTSELEVLPAEIPPHFGSACAERTSQMLLLEEEAAHGRADESFWELMARVYAAFFQWQLPDLGGGILRKLLWRGTALLQKNLSFAMQACAPAAGAFLLLAVERWMSRSMDTLVSIGNPSLTPAAETLKMVANEFWKMYWELRPEIWEHDPPSDAWALALQAGEHRVRHRMRVTNALAAPPNPGAPNSISDDLRWQVELYQCHSKIGPGIVPLLITHTGAARRLLHAGRTARIPLARTDIKPPQRRKLAFLFMVYSELNFPLLWFEFFKSAPAKRYKILIHASEQQRETMAGDARSTEAAAAAAAFFHQFRVSWQPSGWCSIHQVLFELLSIALEDTLVDKAIFLSEDTVPLAAFSQIHQWALSDRGKSWFCLDLEVPRAEAWQLLCRKHMELLVEQRSAVEELQAGSGMCDGEELLLTGLMLLGEWPQIRSRCMTFAQWPLPKYFAVAQRPLLGRPLAIRSDDVQQEGVCAHPTMFEYLQLDHVERLVQGAKPSGGWFARKFSRSTLVELGAGKAALLEDVLLKFLTHFAG